MYSSFFSHYLAFPANKVTPLTQIIWANEVYLTIIYWAFVEAFSNPKPHSSNNKKMSQVILPPDNKYNLFPFWLLRNLVIYPFILSSKCIILFESVLRKALWIFMVHNQITAPSLPFKVWSGKF